MSINVTSSSFSKKIIKKIIRRKRKLKWFILSKRIYCRPGCMQLPCSSGEDAEFENHNKHDLKHFLSTSDEANFTTVHEMECVLWKMSIVMSISVDKTTATTHSCEIAISKMQIANTCQVNRDRRSERFNTNVRSIDDHQRTSFQIFIHLQSKHCRYCPSVSQHKELTKSQTPDSACVTNQRHPKTTELFDSFVEETTQKK